MVYGYVFVQGAVEGALQGTGPVVNFSVQEGKRAAADPRMVAALTADGLRLAATLPVDR